jgi:hypothetical protein
MIGVADFLRGTAFGIFIENSLRLRSGSGGVRKNLLCLSFTVGPFTEGMAKN